MTTQEATTGGLPGATGGALPADRDRLGPGVSVPDPERLERLLSTFRDLGLAAPSPAPADPRADVLWRVIRDYLPGLASVHVDGLVTRIRRTLA